MLLLAQPNEGNMMLTKQFWADALERAAKTFCQTLLASLFVSAGIGIESLPWPQALSLAGSATVLSLLTSVASSSFGTQGSPSLVAETPTGKHEKP